VFIIISITLLAMAGVLSKYASLSLDGVNIMSIISNKLYLLSLCCLVLQAIVWQQALRYYDLSFAYPFMSLVNFLILLSSVILFDEKVTMNNLIGVSVIALGIFSLSRKDRECI